MPAGHAGDSHYCLCCPLYHSVHVESTELPTAVYRKVTHSREQWKGLDHLALERFTPQRIYVGYAAGQPEGKPSIFVTNKFVGN